MKIALCDDCKADMERLKQWILASKFCPHDVELYEFSNGKDLLEHYIAFDAVFLDIQMEGMNGSITGEHIRALDQDVMILFYTGYDMAASKIFRCRPQGYLLKGMNKKDIELNLDTILEELSGKLKQKFPVAGDGKMFILNISDILYVSIFNKGTKIWLTEQAANRLAIPYSNVERAGIKSAVKLDEYYEQLNQFGFWYGNKSYIINVNHVVMRIKNIVQLSDGQELTISRSKKAEFDRAFARHWGVHYGRERRTGDDI